MSGFSCNIFKSSLKTNDQAALGGLVSHMLKGGVGSPHVGEERSMAESEGARGGVPLAGNKWIRPQESSEVFWEEAGFPVGQ